jgi:glyoxylase-like metal-dependent hydrolase (beta-lactamase superfamily II)
VALVELRPHLYRLVLGRFQAYVWRDRDSLTLVDTGEVGSGALVAASLRHAGIALGDLDRVVLTHFHADHVGSAAEIVADTDALVVAHQRDAPIIRGDRQGPAPTITESERELYTQVAATVPSAPRVHVDREVRDGDVLDFGGGAQVVSTPGHTDGSIALYLPIHRVLFTGDIAAHSGGRVTLGVFNLDPIAAAASFARLAALDAEVACFGHGDPLLRAAADRLRSVVARSGT